MAKGWTMQNETFGSYALAFLDSLRASGSRSHGVYRARFTRHVAPELGALRLDELTTPRLRTWVTTLRARAPKLGARAAISPRYVRSIFGFASLVLEHATDEGLIPRNPARARSVLSCLPSDAPAEKRVESTRALTLDEARRLVACRRIRLCDRIVYALVILTGLSATELRGLQWSDVELDAPIPSLRVRRGKTTSRARVIPLHPELVPILRWWKLTGDRAEPAGRCDRHAGRWSTPTAVLRTGPGWHPAERLIKHCEWAEIPARVTFHGLRHTFASLCEDVDIHPFRVAALLGHKTPTIAGAPVLDLPVTRHYARSSLATLAAEIRKIPSVCGGVKFDPVDGTGVQRFSRRTMHHSPNPGSGDPVETKAVKTGITAQTSTHNACVCGHLRGAHVARGCISYEAATEDHVCPCEGFRPKLPPTVPRPTFETRARAVRRGAIKLTTPPLPELTPDELDADELAKRAASIPADRRAYLSFLDIDGGALVLAMHEDEARMVFAFMFSRPAVAVTLRTPDGVERFAPKAGDL